MATFRENVETLFGWAFARTPEEKEVPLSFSPKDTDDGSVAIAAAAGAIGTYLDLDGTVRSDIELITRYRDMAFHPEIDAAVDEITNEMIAGDEPDSVKIVLDDLDQPANVKKAIEECFEEIKQLLDFRRHGHDIARKWYIDGRMYIHTIIDAKDTKAGIQELRWIDPRKIKKIREIDKVRVKNSTSSSFAVLSRVKNEYFVYNDSGLTLTGPANENPSFAPSSGLKISKDAIVYVTSGLTDTQGVRVLGYLQQAIKALNQLRILEDASVIYRLSRAPERRVWKIEVGNLPKMKAEQYVRDIMTKHKNRLNYDASTGEMRDERKFMTILEDYWLPTRGGVGTQVDVLPPGTSFDQMNDILYFQKKLYNSLKVPVGRLNPEEQFDSGVATQITRDEVKFGKFISRLRIRFSKLFIECLRKQCVLKGVMTLQDFDRIAPYFRFDYVKDNYFSEAKDQQIIMMRQDLLDRIAPYIGTFYSAKWVRKNILKQTDDDIEEIDSEIADEAAQVQFMPPMQGEEPGGQGGGMAGAQASVMTDQGPPTPEKEALAKGAQKTNKNPQFKQVSKILSKGT